MTSVIEAPIGMVEAVADLKLPSRADRRLQDLMDRNNDGALTPEELGRAGIVGGAERDDCPRPGPGAPRTKIDSRELADGGDPKTTLNPRMMGLPES